MEPPAEGPPPEYAPRRRAAAELMARAQAGKVTLHSRTYPLDAAPDALADLDAGRVRGRAILIP